MLLAVFMPHRGWVVLCTSNYAYLDAFLIIFLILFDDFIGLIYLNMLLHLALVNITNS